MKARDGDRKTGLRERRPSLSAGNGQPVLSGHSQPAVFILSKEYWQGEGFSQENACCLFSLSIPAILRYKALKTSLRAEIDKSTWETLCSAASRPFPKPESGRIAVKVINHLGDEVMKVFKL